MQCNKGCKVMRATDKLGEDTLEVLNDVVRYFSDVENRRKAIGRSLSAGERQLIFNVMATKGRLMERMLSESDKKERARNAKRKHYREKMIRRGGTLYEAEYSTSSNKVYADTLKELKKKCSKLVNSVSYNEVDTVRVNEYADGKFVRTFVLVRVNTNVKEDIIRGQWEIK